MITTIAAVAAAPIASARGTTEHTTFGIVAGVLVVGALAVWLVRWRRQRNGGGSRGE
jgi:hypothetical protein